MTSQSGTTSSWVGRLAREEWSLAVAIATIIAFFLFGDSLFSGFDNPFWLAFVFTWLFLVVVGSCLGVVRHADGLAHILGEPFGTLILTLSVTTIEVLSISALMLHGGSEPTLVRDTLFSVVMIILGGMTGVSLLIGGWQHREQTHNLQGANAYLGVIVPMTVLSLTLPNFTTTTAGPTLSLAQQIFVIFVFVSLYFIFLAIQTGRHRAYFRPVDDREETAGTALAESRQALCRHAALLVAHILPIAFLAEELANPIDYFIETLHAPAALGGVTIAMIVAIPEAIGAMRAAMTNQLQQSVNIFLGSVLCTIGLTVPVMLVISRLMGRTVELGLTGANNVLLLLTLVVSVITFSSGRTNVLQGAVHLVLFAAFVLLIFQA
jgi:Ca2+:H+ antiporter